jgi:hypothetical protein
LEAQRNKLKEKDKKKEKGKKENTVEKKKKPKRAKDAKLDASVSDLLRIFLQFLVTSVVFLLQKFPFKAMNRSYLVQG